MNTWDSSLSGNRAFQPRPAWFEVFLPASVPPLIGLLLLIFPIFVLTAESLFAPVYEYIRSLLLPVNAGMAYTALPLVLILKIAIFSFFTFTGVALLLLKITCLYYEVWSYFFEQPHPRHVAYHPEQQESMVALFNWNLFRWYKVLGPPVAWVVGTIVLGALGLWFFNSFTDFGFFSFQLQFSLGFFMMAVLSLFTGLAIFKAIVAALTTILGDVAAITEPEKPTQILYERVRKLAFGSFWGIILYPFYFIFYAIVVAEIILLILHYDIQDLLTLRADFLLIFGVEAATLVIFVMLNAMKFMTYHDALGSYYRHHVD